MSKVSVKKLFKAAVGLLAHLLVAPMAYPIAWLKPFDPRHTIFQFGSQLMSLIPGLPGTYLRREYYKIVLDLRSEGFGIEFGTIFAQRGTEIGNNVYIGTFCNIGLSVIEDDVLIGSGVHIVSGKRTHHFNVTGIPIRQQGGVFKKIRIGSGSWIGNNAVILESVREGCIIGAGSVVTAETKPWMIIAGNPARPIRARVGAAMATLVAEGEGEGVSEAARSEGA